MLEKQDKKKKLIPMIFDPIFKSILQDKEVEDYLVDLIYGITGIKKEKIKGHIIFKNVEHVKNSKNEKGKVSDLILEIEDSIINIEVNNYLEGTFDKNDNYIYKLYGGLVKKGENYKNIRKTRLLQINFDNFKSVFKDSIIKFKTMDEKSGIDRSVYTKNTSIEFYHVNLQNIYNMYYTKDTLSKFEKELLLMVLNSEEELTEISKGDKEMQIVVKKIIKINKDEELQGIYDKEEQDAFVKERIKYHATIEGYELGEQKGLSEGMLVGKAEGKAEGKIEGRVEGEKNKQIEIAKNMIQNNMEDELIVKLTGLSNEELEKIKTNL